MKKLNTRKLTLSRDTLRHLDATVLGRMAGGIPVNQTGTANPAPAKPFPFNTVNGTSCGLCSDYIYCGPTAEPQQ